MKSKLVLWGSNAQDEKLMIAVALNADENKVDIYTFPESVATEDFYQKMMKEWRDGAGLEFPDPHTHLERELSMSESLLPDDLKVERTDVVQRAQTEWHFLVLSAKLHQSYEDQITELKGRIDQLDKYDQGMWDNLKEFWGKVQEQMRERNLVREHADLLRENTNALFATMKSLRSKMDAEFERVSKEAHDKFMASLDEVEKKVNDGARLTTMFEELKKLQRKFKDTKLTRDHRRKIWDKLDAVFKEVKRRRFGDKAADEGNSPLQRVQRRYDGLIAAIGKMEASIKRDRNDLDFQNHKIATTSGQLEAQIRQAKLKMIEERINSKEEKLKDMNATKAELEKRIAKLKEQEARREAERAAKAKIAQEAKANAAAMEKEAEKLAKAAEEIAEGKSKSKTEEKKDDSVLGALSATLGESLGDVMDTAKAVASVIADKVEEAIEEAKEDLSEVVEEVKEEAAEVKKDVEKVVSEIKEEATEVAAEIKEEVAEKVAEVKEEAKAIKEVVAEKVAEAKEEVVEKVAEVKEKVAAKKSASELSELVNDASAIASAIDEAVPDAA